jgi:hypothetical protein
LYPHNIAIKYLLHTKGFRFNAATAPAGLSLHWAEGDLLLNVQFDGENSGNGSIKAYLDKLIIYRW